MIIPNGKTIQLRGGKILKEGDEISDADAKKYGLIKDVPKKANESKTTSGS